MTEADEKQLSDIERSIEKAREWSDDSRPSFLLDAHTFLCTKVRALDKVYENAAALIDSTTHPEAQKALVALKKSVLASRRPPV